MQIQIVDVGMVVVRPFRFKLVYSLSSVLSKFSYSNVVQRFGFVKTCCMLRSTLHGTC